MSVPWVSVSSDIKWRNCTKRKVTSSVKFLTSFQHLKLRRFQTKTWIAVFSWKHRTSHCWACDTATRQQFLGVEWASFRQGTSPSHVLGSCLDPGFSPLPDSVYLSCPMQRPLATWGYLNLTKLNKLKSSVSRQFWVFSSHTWLLATERDNTVRGHFHHPRKLHPTKLHEPLKMWPQAEWTFWIPCSHDIPASLWGDPAGRDWSPCTRVPFKNSFLHNLLP